MTTVQLGGHRIQRLFLRREDGVECEVFINQIIEVPYNNPHGPPDVKAEITFFFSPEALAILHNGTVVESSEPLPISDTYVEVEDEEFFETLDAFDNDNSHSPDPQENETIAKMNALEFDELETIERINWLEDI